MSDVVLRHSLDRAVRFRARRERVFAFLSETERWASWWGAGSSIEPVAGGSVAIRYPNGVEAGGEVLEIEPPSKLAFGFGYASGRPIPLGASRVQIDLVEEAGGTLLRLRHELADAAARDQHVQGWRYQLAVLANAVAESQHGAAIERVDAWFAAWSAADPARRAQLLDGAAAPGIAFRDRFGSVEGRAELEAHLEAVQRFLPETRITRNGPIRVCQGAALADWRSTGPDGAERGHGTNWFRFDADLRIEEVVGFWSH
ncbi:MAG TPA: SRPBCC domain-containing protein [Thermoanaerobaculia bacterium]|nr:SRPBCC domain-containing protein [Thermoanaerobaculia bacterium]